MSECLKNLSDEELVEYHNLMLECSSRGLKAKAEGEDWKFLYHVVRLLLECEQILIEGDLDLQRHNEQLKAIRRGEWTLQKIEEFFESKEKQLEEVYNKSEAIPYSPDEKKIKALLIKCLEHHYGSLEGVYHNPDEAETALRQIKEIIEKLKI